MFYRLSLILSILFISFSGQAQETYAYDIKVKFKGINETPKNVQLAHYYGNSQFLKVDSAKAENGVIRFKGKAGLQGGMYVVVLSASKYYDFLVSGTESEFTIEADTADFLNTVKFTGSKENEVLYSYRKYLSDKTKDAMAIQKALQTYKEPEAQEANKKKMKGMQEEVTSYIKNTIKANEGSFAAKIIKVNMEPELPTEVPMLANGRKDSTFMYRTYKKKFFENLDFSDERFIRTPFLQTKLEKYFKDLVYQVTDSITVDADRVLLMSKKHKEVYRYTLWFLSNKYENINIIGLDGVFVHLAENHYLKDADWMDATQKNKIQERVDILKPIITGKVMPLLILQDTLGRDVNLMDIKAKYTVVYFYRYDCGHCQDHAPELMKFYEETKDKGVAIYHAGTHETGDMEEELTKTKAFIKKYKTDRLINVLDLKLRYDFRKRYDVYKTPTIFILDSEKKILAKGIPLEEVKGFIEFHEKRMAAKK
ncbi:TlpA_like_family domain containing protein [Spirosomataceae bacterium]|jgi:peroxiredoxin